MILDRDVMTILQRLRCGNCRMTWQRARCSLE
jgi:hypothetical protein